MLPRRLSKILQASPAKRFDILAEGLEMLADSIKTLAVDASTLGDIRRHQGSAVLRSFAEEEAAKVLILLDLARAGWADHVATKTGLSAFYSHLGRGLYVEAYDGSPADLAEVRRYVDLARRQFYLDGPMDVDWIFANEVITEREERLYVDYVEDEHGDRRWTGPAERASIYDEPFKTPPPTSVIVDLVAAMRHVGLLTKEGLTLTMSVWDGIELTDSTHWQEVRKFNIGVLERLLASRERDPTTDEVESARFVVEHWIFPMTSLDLKMLEVSREDIEAERERRLAREMGVDEEFGY